MTLVIMGRAAAVPGKTLTLTVSRNADLLTCDAHFDNLPGVLLFRK